MASLADAAEDARRDFDALNEPVASPLPALIHPHVAARISVFLTEAGINDVLAPLHGESLEEMTARYRAESKTAHDEAVEGLRQIEVEKAQALADEAVAKVEAIRRAGHAGTENIVAEAIEPKRTRSRPAVASDENEMILPT